MPIKWDPLLVRHTARELDERLGGARLRALRMDGETRELALLLREHTLVWRLHPTDGAVHLLDPVEPSASDLRLKARVAGVSAVPDDRLVHVRLAAGSAQPPLTVVVELLGNQWNAVVVEDDGQAGTARHVLWRRASERAARVGYPYRPPPALRRAGIDGELSLEAWLELLEPLAPPERRRALVRSVAWASPLNAAALVGGDLVEGHALWSHMVREETPSRPVVIETDAGRQPYPFPFPGVVSEPFENLLAAIEACADGAELRPSGDSEPWAAGIVAGVGPELMRRLERAARRAARREERLRRERRDLDDPAGLRALGDLILARYRDIPSGASSARLTSFTGEEVEVALDPALPPHENAARYYQRAAKVERAREQLPRLTEEARLERVRLEELLRAAATGEVNEEEVREALGPEPSVVRGQPTGPALPYRSFRSSGGLEIRVGRGARHNDDLTFHHSSPDDVWLHARDSAGAHVILRWPGPGRPPARDLAEAATLAALHSKARTSGSAPVDWTLRKYVRKPRKSPPGRVVAERIETLFVTPDAGVLDRLEPLR